MYRVGGPQVNNNNNIEAEPPKGVLGCLRTCFFLLFPSFKIKSVTFIYVMTFIAVFAIA
jgi:hypothetical protein